MTNAVLCMQNFDWRGNKLAKKLLSLKLLNTTGAKTSRFTVCLLDLAIPGPGVEGSSAYESSELHIPATRDQPQRGSRIATHAAHVLASAQCCTGMEATALSDCT